MTQLCRQRQLEFNTAAQASSSRNRATGQAGSYTAQYEFSQVQQYEHEPQYDHNSGRGGPSGGSSQYRERYRGGGGGGYAY